MNAVCARLCVCLLALALSARAQDLPDGFVLEPMATAGVGGPTALAQLSDGRWLFCQKNGLVKLLAAGAITQVGSVSTLSFSEQGLMGIAVDPAWPQQPFVYLYHTTLSSVCHLVRLRASGDLSDSNSSNLSLGSPYLLIDDIPDADAIHQAGCLRFGDDGMLYLSSGDDHFECLAQDPESLLGCILRLDVAAAHGETGSGPPPKSLLAAPGNPFTGPNSQLVWAFGLRNPWRFALDGSELWVGDVGAATWEEISRVTAPGANLGWPYMEGPAAHSNPCNPGSPPFQGPIYSWIHGSGGFAASIFGGIYRNRLGQPFNFGPDYEGDLFINDLAQGWVRRLKVSGSSVSIAPAVPGQPDTFHWANGMIRAVDVVPAQDGSLMLAIMTPPLVGLHRLRPVIQPHLSVLSGDGARGVAGRPLDTPIALRAFDAQGTPVAGLSVSFAVSSGAGSFSSASVVTDAEGVASTTFTPGSSSSDDITIVASAAGHLPASFHVEWRGLAVDLDPQSATLSLLVRGAGANAPITLAADTPVASPHAILPWGPLWTSIAQPSFSLLVLDGMGLVGPVLPAMLADAQGEWGLAFPGLPAFGGLPLVFQAYAVDPGLFPAGESVLISNEVYLTLP